MKKNRLTFLIVFIFILIVSAPFLFISYLNYGNPLMNYWVESSVTEHLSESYDVEEDILETKIYRPKMITNEDYYQTLYLVRFKDEPHIDYYYGKKKYFGAIEQFCEKTDRSAPVSDFITDEMENSEEECRTIYHEKRDE